MIFFFIYYKINNCFDEKIKLEKFLHDKTSPLLPSKGEFWKVDNLIIGCAASS